MKKFGQLEISRMAFDGEMTYWVEAEEAEKLKRQNNEMLKVLKKSVLQMNALSVYQEYFWQGEKLAFQRHLLALQTIIAEVEQP
jgi:hypothetical protein